MSVCGSVPTGLPGQSSDGVPHPRPAGCPAYRKSGQCDVVDDRDDTVIIYRFFPFKDTLSHTQIKDNLRMCERA